MTHEVRRLRLECIVPDPAQPRQHFGTDDLATLAESMAQVGQLQPIIVRSDHPAGYVLIAGERRYRAARSLGWEEIDAIVRDDVDVLTAQLVENIARADMRPIETARAYRRLVDRGHTPADVAKLVGVSTRSVNLALQLLELIPQVQELVERGHIEPQHARQMAGLNPEYQQVALRRYLNASRPMTNMEFGGVCEVLLKQQNHLTLFDETIAPEEHRRAKRELDEAVDRCVAILAKLSEQSDDELRTTMALNPLGYLTKIDQLYRLTGRLAWRTRYTAEAVLTAHELRNTGSS